MEYDGILLVDKPIGWSSFDVVAKVRGQLKHITGVKKPKVGHTGTLDPLAAGLMILVLGSYCKRAQEFSKLDKSYDVGLLLGQTSSTGDAEGEITPGDNRQPSAEEVHHAIQQFVGDIMQTPPSYSAIKINGQRAYALARAGKEVILQPRQVTINNIDIASFAYPEVRFVTSVSSGTYIRSLVEDIGSQLRTGAYMNSLTRTSIGSYNLKDAIAVDDKLSEVLLNAILKP